MNTFYMNLNKNFGLPVIKIMKLNALIDTGAVVPVFSIPASLNPKIQII